MTYKILLTETAIKDLSNIKSFISLDNKIAAEKYIKKIIDRLELLKDYPLKGPKVQNSFFEYAQARYLICLNHVAIYQVNNFAKSINVLRVLSHFQDWKNIVNKDLLNKQKIIIESDRLLITKIDVSMYYDIYRNSLDDDVKKYVPDETFGSLEEASDVVDNIICNYESTDGPFVYAVIRKSDRVNLGYIQLIKNGNQCEIGYHIAKLFTNCGYATEAVKIFLEYVKNTTDIKEVIAIALSNNKASKSVLQKSGFEIIFEGNGIYQQKRRKIIKAFKEIKKHS